MVLLAVPMVHDVPDVDFSGEFRETLRKLSEKFSSMVSVHDMTHAPLVLGAYDRFQRAITDHGTFDLRTREAVALTVAAVAECAECQFTRTVGCRAAGWTREQTLALRAGEPIPGDDRLTALLAVARQFAGGVGEVDEDTWRQALQTGWTVEELAELFTHVIANIFAGYLDHCTRDEPHPTGATRCPAVGRRAGQSGDHGAGPRVLRAG